MAQRDIMPLRQTQRSGRHQRTHPQHGAGRSLRWATASCCPCVFSLYLHPDDHARLEGVFELIAEDARRALGARVAQLNTKPKILGMPRPGRQPKEYKIAGRDWTLEFLRDTEGSVPLGDVEIHSELNETAQPGFAARKPH